MKHVKGNIFKILETQKVIEAQNTENYHHIVFLVNPMSEEFAVGNLKRLCKFLELEDSARRGRFIERRCGLLRVTAINYRWAMNRDLGELSMSNIATKYLQVAHKKGKFWQYAKPNLTAMTEYLRDFRIQGNDDNYIIVLPSFFGDNKTKAIAIAIIEDMQSNCLLVTPQGPKVPKHQLVYNSSIGQYSMQNVEQTSPALVAPQ